MNKTEIQRVLKAAKKMKVAVIGDIMLDKWIDCVADRLCPEAPVPALKPVATKYGLGGAANVAANVASLQATVELFGWIGTGLSGDHVGKLCDRAGIVCGRCMLAASTTVKTRYMVGSTQVMRVDEDNRTTWRHCYEFDYDSFDLVIVSDYAKGAVTKQSVNGVPQSITVVAPKPPIKFEWPEVLAVVMNQAENNAYNLGGRRINAKHICVTCGSKGAFVKSGGTMFDVPANPVENANAVGAGDTFLAAFSVALIVTDDPVKAAEFGNAAAAVVVRQPYTTAVDPSLL